MISIVMTFHREGFRAVGPLKLARAGAVCLERAGIPYEWICVLDRGDEGTKGILEDFLKQPGSSGFRLMEVDVGDAGAARNRGARASKGDIVGILDGDDGVTPEFWPEAARRTAEDAKRIVRPAGNLHYGSEHVWWPHPLNPVAKRLGATLFYQNVWSSLCVADKSVFSTIPYIEMQPDSGWGFEDWHWNILVEAAGCSVLTVPKTIRFAQRRSLAQREKTHLVSNAALPPTKILLSDAYVDSVRALHRFCIDNESAVAHQKAAQGQSPLMRTWLAVRPFISASVLERIREVRRTLRHEQDTPSTSHVFHPSDWGVAGCVPSWVVGRVAEAAHSEPALQSSLNALREGECEHWEQHLLPDPHLLAAWTGVHDWLADSAQKSLEIPSTKLFSGCGWSRSQSLIQRAWIEQGGTLVESDPANFRALEVLSDRVKKQLDCRVRVTPRSAIDAVAHAAELSMSGACVKWEFESGVDERGFREWFK